MNPIAFILVSILAKTATIAPTTIAVSESRTWIVCEHVPYSSSRGRCDAFEADTMGEALRAARELVGQSSGVILTAQSLHDAKAGRE